MPRRSKPVSWFAVPLLMLAWIAPSRAEPGQLNTLKDVFADFQSCWKPPPASQANPIDITVVVSFNREGAILGHPRITYNRNRPATTTGSPTGSR